MAFLSFDISTGGISAALFNSKLDALNFAESSWQLRPDEAGAATLSVENILAGFKQVAAAVQRGEPLEAVCISSFMHNSVLLDDSNQPLTPIHTWLDRRGENGMEYVRSRMGRKFHERTGCQYHPMFPVFKLATFYLGDSGFVERAKRVVSIKSLLVHRLTGIWAEDHGMASASGLYNILNSDWDPGLLGLLGLKRDVLPAVTGRSAIVGRVTLGAASEFGIPSGTPVVNGSGDGFLATVGSGCESPNRLAVSLGTSASVRQTLSNAALDPSAGTFCYRSDENSYLLGCASSNGGNVLDWGRALFGELPQEPRTGVPTFIPLLHGERSPDWDPRLTGAWHGLTSQHTAADLAQSILEGVVFNLAHYVEILQPVSGRKADHVVLSGNGFLQHLAARLLAAVVEAQVRIPLSPGLATLRGAATCALRGLGLEVPTLHTELVLPLEDSRTRERFQKYKILRKTASSGYFLTT